VIVSSQFARFAWGLVTALLDFLGPVREEGIPSPPKRLLRAKGDGRWLKWTVGLIKSMWSRT